MVLPVPGRADHQDVVRAGGGHDQGPLGELLAADVAEVNVVDVELGKQLFEIGRDGFGGQLAGQDADCLAERADAVDGDDFDDGGLAGVGRGHEQLGDAQCRRRPWQSTERP